MAFFQSAPARKSGGARLRTRSAGAPPFLRPRGALCACSPASRSSTAPSAALATLFTAPPEAGAPRGSSKMAAQRRSLLQSVRKPTRSPGWGSGARGVLSGAGAVLPRWWRVTAAVPSLRRPGARAAPGDPRRVRPREALRVRTACPTAGDRGRGDLLGGSVLEPEGNVAPQSQPGRQPG